MFWKKKEPPRQERTPADDFNRYLIETYNEAFGQLRLLSENREAFELQAAAIFVLQQDLKVALRVNLCDLAGTIAHHGGAAFVENLGSTLIKIIEVNEDFIAQSANDQQKLPAVIMARLRLTAARVWLLTFFSEVRKDASTKAGVATIWLLLSQVPVKDIVKHLIDFSGTYFSEAHNDQPALNEWPYRSRL